MKGNSVAYEALHKFYVEKMKLKLTQMKLHLLGKLKDATDTRKSRIQFGKEVETNRETNKAFEEIMEFRKDYQTEENYKIKGLYSYNWLDHPEYINAKKIERKIIKYNDKIKKKKKFRKDMKEALALKITKTQSSLSSPQLKS